MFHHKLFEELTSFLHNVVLAAIVCIKDKFVSYDVIGALKTQLLGHIGGSDFEHTVFGLNEIVNKRYVNVIPCDISIGSIQFNYIHCIFIVFSHDLTW